MEIKEKKFNQVILSKNEKQLLRDFEFLSLEILDIKKEKYEICNYYYQILLEILDEYSYVIDYKKEWTKRKI